MKKAIGFSFAVLGIVFLTSMIMNHSSAQSSQKDGTVSKPISPGVMKIYPAQAQTNDFFNLSPQPP
jgi:hypothetical protein